jgi:DNA-binding transcriptional regulator YdaS (Cro superfamily)
MSTPIEKAVETVGSRVALASALGVSPSLVWQWLNGKRPVAASHCRAIEAATNGAVTRYELRPDVFGDAPEQQAA